MKRRSLFKLLACAVAASAMEVCGMVPITLKTPKSVVFVSAPICITDIRNAYNFRAYVESTINNLADLLPSKTGYRIEWVNVYDKAENPYRNKGCFWAIPDESSKSLDFKNSGIVEDLTSKNKSR